MGWEIENYSISQPFEGIMKKIIISIVILGALALLVYKHNIEITPTLNNSEIVLSGKLNKTQILLRKYLINNEYLIDSSIVTVQFENLKNNYISYLAEFDTLSNGNYIISEYASDKFIGLFSSSGKFIREIGRSGQGPGEYILPDNISVKNDTIYRYDKDNKKLCLFNSEGEFITEYKIILYISDIILLKDKPIIIGWLKNGFVPNIYPISIANYQTNSILNFGSIENINLPILRAPIKPGICTDGKNIFCLEPMKFGFKKYDFTGELVNDYFPIEVPSIFSPVSLKKYNYLIDKNSSKLSKAYQKHAKCRAIFYLGNDILAIQILGDETKNDYKLNYLSFFTTSGQYLGALRIGKHRINKVSNGKIYYWEENTKFINGKYGNSKLNIIDFWKNIGVNR